MLRLLWILAPALAACQEPLITGLASVGFRVSDLENARRFYTGVLGFEQAFLLKESPGAVERVFLKVNDAQFIELQPGLAAGEKVRMTHLVLETADARRLHRLLEQRALAPSPLTKRPDGNLGFRLRDPEGTSLEFVEYLPGGLQAGARGRFLGPRRVSTHLRHAGVTAGDLERALAFYRDQLGLVETWRGGPSEAELRWINLRLPGPRGDYIELMLYATPPNRQQLGSMQHICLEVPDIQAAYQQAVRQGWQDEERFRPRIGRNGRWLANLFDPDGSRTELMEPHPAQRPALQ